MICGPSRTRTADVRPPASVGFDRPDGEEVQRLVEVVLRGADGPAVVALVDVHVRPAADIALVAWMAVELEDQRTADTPVLVWYVTTVRSLSTNLSKPTEKPCGRWNHCRG